MSAERERIKRAMGIGEHPGENDLSANEFRVTTYIHIHGVKHEVDTIGRLYRVQVAPGRQAYGESLEELRENAEEIFAGL